MELPISGPAADPLCVEEPRQLGACLRRRAVRRRHDPPGLVSADEGRPIDAVPLGAACREVGRAGIFSWPRRATKAAFSFRTVRRDGARDDFASSQLPHQVLSVFEREFDNT